MFSIIQAAGWPIWPLIICSVIGMALVIERFLTLKKNRIVPPTLLDEAIQASRKAVPPPDVVKQLAQNSELGEVLASGMQALNSDPRCTEGEMRSAMEAAGRKVTHRLERFLTPLATIASAAPLLGLLGTVIGMIEIFAAQSGGANANPAQLASGISIALYNTAFGLIVAIPALIFWKYFRARVDGLVLSIEASAEQFARHLNAVRKRRQQPPEGQSSSAR